jgi:hypothetical protein
MCGAFSAVPRALPTEVVRILAGSEGALNVAVMQPYFFPYAGYFQLLSAVDLFVFLEDAAFIKKGWINRNTILLGERPHLVTVPVRDASQNRTIQDTEVAADAAWTRRTLRTLETAYRGAPHFEPVLELVSSVLTAGHRSIASLARASVDTVAGFLGIATRTESSTAYGNASLRGEERIVDICMREGATRYVNPIGGLELYRAASFEARGIELRFLRSGDVRYQQRGDDFVPRLSIIDVLMWNGREGTARLLRDYSLVEGRAS